MDLHAACRQEFEWWRQKSRCKWLNDGDRNIGFFHKQAEARKNHNCVLEIQANDRAINNFDEIKSEAARYFSDLFTDQPTSNDAELLNLVPRTVKNKDNDNLKKSSRWKKLRKRSIIWRRIEPLAQMGIMPISLKSTGIS